jgi:hypothetical protein
MPADKPTRFATDLLDSAAAEGAREGRSAKQQLDHWVRVGRAVSMHSTAMRHRVEAALRGTLPMTGLTAEERTVVNAELDASINAAAQRMSFGDRLAAEGVVTVALDDKGDLVERHPDGTLVPLR